MSIWTKMCSKSATATISSVPVLHSTPTKQSLLQRDIFWLQQNTGEEYYVSYIVKLKEKSLWFQEEI